MEFPITIRMPYGGGVRAPGAARRLARGVLRPHAGDQGRDPVDAGRREGLLAAAIRDPDPVVIFEPKLVYRTARGEVPEGEHVVPLGQARIAREGSDVTLIAYGAMVAVCERAADELDVSCEVVDIRSLRPLDEETILASVAKTGRVVIVPRGAAHRGLRRRARGADRRAGDLRPAGPGPARHRLRRAVSVLDDRGRLHAVGRRVRRDRTCSGSGSSATLASEPRATHVRRTRFANRRARCRSDGVAADVTRRRSRARARVRHNGARCGTSRTLRAGTRRRSRETEPVGEQASSGRVNEAWVLRDVPESAGSLGRRDGVRVQAARPRRGPDRGRDRPLARRRGRRDRRRTQPLVEIQTDKTTVEIPRRPPAVRRGSSSPRARSSRSAPCSS